MKVMSGVWHRFIWLQEGGTPRWYSCCCVKELSFTGKCKHVCTDTITCTCTNIKSRDTHRSMLYYTILYVMLSYTCKICSAGHQFSYMWLYKSISLVSLACSDYKGWTCLHHAASEGYTQTMDILLSANLKLLDKTDEDGVWITVISKMSTTSKSLLIHAFLFDD